MIPPPKRLRPLRTALAGACVLGTVATAAALSTPANAATTHAAAATHAAATHHAAAAIPAHFAAPYLQISDSDAGDMAADMSSSGVSRYSLAFLTSQSGCTLQWEDGGDGVGAFTSQINSLKAAGGDVIPSFGGAGSTELAQSCTDVSSLTAAYKNVVDTYGVTRLDFDIEGDVINDTASTTRRDQALAALQQEEPGVQIDFTLSVDPGGLPPEGLSLLQDAKNQGVNVSVVNLMTMDYGDGQPVINDALSSAQGGASQLANLYGISTAAAYAKEGLTPIAGTNDDGSVFSQGDAQTLENFASTNGVAELSFWEVDAYDKGAGYAYSRIFNAITGTSGGNPPPPNGSGPITGYQGLCLDDRGASTANLNPVQVYTCNGSNAQSWTVNSSNNTLQDLGKCLDINSAGTADGTTVDLYDCNGTGAQVWVPQSNGELRNPASGRCLDDTGFGGSGTQAQIWDCADSSNQKWTLP
ncbi:ricin-type beta-trefoil lectin domain protein [Catenulispora sp. NF23]|uniref:Ricin-type beta-trefoil lectin domain protein n=1 Tax=Catenulispora pinistramenti TaxID=2705254 RepID=A0ABS5KT51_9ACTN|nr:ricin-type beta-trefoil lectin domain protein [Catenulispora pinistramenti]MBS2535057.1 ricin-type beta-trefoil lectin domain protein [Catenulispora pinistramenti]MBS2549227.1 ricin-type beta-trefoil lectin domain protein [Catenulispora pinistramenti]